MATYYFGTSENDIIIGDDDTNFYVPGPGTDVIFGAKDARNLLFYLYEEQGLGGTRGVTVDLDREVATDTFGDTDFFVRIDSVVGTTRDDKIYGNDSDNYIFDAGGSNYFDGRGGYDVASFYYVGGGGVIADLAAGQVRNSLGQVSTLVSIEGVEGTKFNDQLAGDSNDNVLMGSGGNDRLTGLAGDDILDGGSGTDTAWYFTNGGSGGVHVDLRGGFFADDSSAGYAFDQYGGLDRLTGIENVTGSRGNDTLIDNSGNNVLNGAAGNDLIIGSGGDNHFIGGLGNDIFMASTSGHDTIEDFSAGDQIWLDPLLGVSSIADVKALAALDRNGDANLDLNFANGFKLTIVGWDPAKTSFADSFIV
jgi:serralysin